MIVNFGDCALDVGARQLRRHGIAVPLSPKGFELLCLLVAERPTAIAKTELLERVWQGVYVSDASLARTISEIRTAIGDAARRPVWLRTVHGFGYAFGETGTADEKGELPRWWLVCAGTRYNLRPGSQTLGRDRAADVFLDSARVSRKHAQITVGESGVTIEDLGSKNGTFVGSEQIENRTTLKAGDAVRIGPFQLVLIGEAPTHSTEAEILSI